MDTAGKSFIDSIIHFYQEALTKGIISREREKSRLSKFTQHLLDAHSTLEKPISAEQLRDLVAESVRTKFEDSKAKRDQYTSLRSPARMGSPLAKFLSKRESV